MDLLHHQMFFKIFHLRLFSTLRKTWPHKNHLRLLEALAYNRDYFGVVNSLICTGRQSDYWPAIREKISPNYG